MKTLKRISSSTLHNDVPHDIGYVLGNGPSRDRDKTQYDGITYGCNSIYQEFPIDVLVVMDAWYQFQVIASGYPLEHECLFGSYNPMPIGVPPESLNPPHYGIHYYNPEDRKRADSWYYYATSAEDYEKAKKENYAMSYWKPDCGYVCFVGKNYKIKEVDYGVLPIKDLRPPSGAYAFQEALKGGHDKIEVFGFDSMSGIFSTSSQLTFKDHDTDDTIQERMDKWLTFYKIVVDRYNVSNDMIITWHSKKYDEGD